MDHFLLTCWERVHATRQEHEVKLNVKILNPVLLVAAAKSASKEDDGGNLLEMIAGAQGHRMNEQRAGASALLPGLASSKQPEVVL